LLLSCPSATFSWSTSSSSSWRTHWVYPYMKPLMSRRAFKCSSKGLSKHSCLHFRHGHLISVSLFWIMFSVADFNHLVTILSLIWIMIFLHDISKREPSDSNKISAWPMLKIEHIRSARNLPKQKWINISAKHWQLICIHTS
jgi:hypothetical protein